MTSASKVGKESVSEISARAVIASDLAQLETPHPELTSLCDTQLGGKGGSVDHDIVRRTFYKTLCYEAVSAVFDFGFGVITGSEFLALGGIVLANFVTDVPLTYVHDLVWAMASRGSGRSEADTRPVRTTTHVAVNAAQAYGLGLLFTGSVSISGVYVATNLAANAVVYVVNDMIWDWYWPVTQSQHRLAKDLRMRDHLPHTRMKLIDRLMYDLERRYPSESV
jgi:uncharacterized membrane protein